MQFYYFYHKLFVSIDLRLVFPQAENLPPWWGVFSSSWVVIWFYFLLRSISWRCVNITFDYVRRVNCVTLHYACHGTQHCITWQGISPRITIYSNVILLYCTSMIDISKITHKFEVFIEITPKIDKMYEIVLLQTTVLVPYSWLLPLKGESRVPLGFLKKDIWKPVRFGVFPLQL